MMDAATLIKVAAWLVVEAVKAGAQISQVLAAARDDAGNHNITPEMWAAIVAEIKANEAAWKAAP